MHAVAAEPAQAGEPQSVSAATFAHRPPADGQRDLQRRSSWEVADDYNRRLWLRQAGGAALVRLPDAVGGMDLYTVGRLGCVPAVSCLLLASTA